MPLGKRSGWVLCNEANQYLLLTVYGIEAETMVRIEDERSARDILQALAFIRRPDFLGRRTVWYSQEHIVLRKQRTTGHDVQIFDRDSGSVSDAVARGSRR